MASNKTIRGVGSSSGLTGSGLKIKSVSNVIIQNMKISKVLAANGNGDSIHIEKSNHIFLDHNDLSSDTTHGTDYYDGLLDITHAGGLHHGVVQLLPRPRQVLADRPQRRQLLRGHRQVPRHLRPQLLQELRPAHPEHPVRHLHCYNNYFVGGAPACTPGWAPRPWCRATSGRRTAVPIETTKDSSVDGYVNASDNNYGGGTNLITRTGSMTSVPYTSSLGSTATTAAFVTANAGTGKI